ncbi:DUF305 domain-containing protein [Xylanimonas ulmi]|nr:DUF305 domain-containing protein [Xylanibacterium ulmi]
MDHATHSMASPSGPTATPSPAATGGGFGFQAFDPGSVRSGPADVLPTDVDLAFAVRMIPHHRAAVEMAQMLLTVDGLDPQIRELGEWVERDQQREIDLMTEWLDAWDTAYPELDAWRPADEAMAAVGDGMGPMPHDDGPMDMSPGAATHDFLVGMIPHHQGAIAMARVAVDQGDNAFVDALAHHVITEQGVEIDAMRALLTRFG